MPQMEENKIVSELMDEILKDSESIEKFKKGLKIILERHSEITNTLLKNSIS